MGSEPAAAKPVKSLEDIDVNGQKYGYIDVAALLAKERAIDQYKLNFWSKAKQKFMRDPFVPLGVAVTTFALTNGIYAMWKGDSAKSNKMMRLRVGAQGFTIVMLAVGLLGSQFLLARGYITKEMMEEYDRERAVKNE